MASPQLSSIAPDPIGDSASRLRALFLNQLDLVAVGILDEGDLDAAELHRTRLAHDLDALNLERLVEVVHPNHRVHETHRLTPFAAGGVSARAPCGDCISKFVLQLVETLFSGRDSRPLHPLDQLPSFHPEHPLRLMLVQPLEANEFQDCEFADARAEVLLAEIVVEDVCGQIELDFHRTKRFFPRFVCGCQSMPQVSATPRALCQCMDAYEKIALVPHGKPPSS